jgi:hypothetical protein
MCWHISKLRDNRGQATVEAAFALPILFVMVLMLVQPGIILYDRMVMESAAAEGCRLLATRCDDAGFDTQRCENLIRRHLGAIPPQELFHMHEGGCSWQIGLLGGEHVDRASVTIRNRIRLLPLFDAAGALAGIADEEGCLTIEVREEMQTQPLWVASNERGLDPAAWVRSRDEEDE